MIQNSFSNTLFRLNQTAMISINGHSHNSKKLFSSSKKCATNNQLKTKQKTMKMLNKKKLILANFQNHSNYQTNLKQKKSELITIHIAITSAKPSSAYQSNLTLSLKLRMFNQQSSNSKKKKEEYLNNHMFATMFKLPFQAKQSKEDILTLNGSRPAWKCSILASQYLLLLKKVNSDDMMINILEKE